MKNPKNNLNNFSSILITGATSGIGAELARQYAATGVTLALTGRDSIRLARIETECLARGAKVISKSLDISEDVAMARWINKLPALDLVIANAGISGGTALDENAEREIFSTNIGGVLNTILPAIEKMKKKKHGHIAIMASLAGIRGLPSAPAYAATKACMLSYGQGLRGSLKPLGIKVSTICPGYIKTPLTAKNKFYMPFLMTAPKAAKIIRRGIEKNKSIIAFPRSMYALLKILDFMPVIITDKIFARLPEK